MEEGRAKVTAAGGVTQQGAAGSRSSEAVVELLSADVDGRRGTEDTVCCWWWCHWEDNSGNLKSAGTG